VYNCVYYCDTYLVGARRGPVDLVEAEAVHA
jgi:hypothetical protein